MQRAGKQVCRGISQVNPNNGLTSQRVDSPGSIQESQRVEKSSKCVHKVVKDMDDQHDQESFHSHFRIIKEYFSLQQLKFEHEKAFRKEKKDSKYHLEKDKNEQQ
ncbi:hypothetical protein O181_114835 [Austropuccinia psidii MF-1]|uniref:Uncharacterized protein n=1 Tax=Austropuccinia psidii MF-1 TaxID=1389203 RepID=A0A9Q3PVV9_9BASI|nr:hypothetical protein [Austropuccinia psidii MF-1]